MKTKTIEAEYIKNTKLAHRKKFAQFFTPYSIASLMSRWIVGNKNLKTVLEPAFGLGVFSRILLSQKPKLQIKGYDIDATILNEAKKGFRTKDNVEIELKDYIFSNWSEKYDGIICNPPYFKFHDYDNKSVLKEINNKLKVELNGFTNLYAIFLLKSLSQLQPKGRSAYIVPSEFLNADYGKIVKKHLLQSQKVRHIIIIDFKENIFGNVLTTACIILCANETKKHQKIQFTTIHTLSELEKVEDLIDSYPNYNSKNGKIYDIAELNPQLKWRSYYQTQNTDKFKNLVPFDLYGKVVRGIATGANEYFTFTQDKPKKPSINTENLLPCICKATDVKNACFTEADFKILKSNNRPVFLFHAKDSTEENVFNYIKKGEEKQIHERYLTSSRTPWYALEKRPPAPIWLSVFNRKGLRFVRNEAKISNLTTFHCVYPTKNNTVSEIPIDLLFAYLLTDTAKKIFEDNRREYGNGLQKFEPNDINKSNILNLNLLSQGQKSKILNLYIHYKNAVLSGNTDTVILNEIDEILINEFRK